MSGLSVPPGHWDGDEVAVTASPPVFAVPLR